MEIKNKKKPLNYPAAMMEWVPKKSKYEKKSLDLANLELNKKKISSLNEESMRFIKGGEDLSNGEGIDSNGLVEVGVDVGIGDDGEAINPKTRFMCLTLAAKCSNRCSMASCAKTDGGVVIACIPL